jgi:hypothetical protein
MGDLLDSCLLGVNLAPLAVRRARGSPWLLPWSAGSLAVSTKLIAVGDLGRVRRPHRAYRFLVALLIHGRLGATPEPVC